mmetsp:Transcript_19711/g.16465  ORF Transcript_19711/g.16465 Transcript_19711/m.16465 type:complete len:94 (+) Transcript_19711:84-365(+)
MKEVKSNIIQDGCINNKHFIIDNNDSTTCSISGSSSTSTNTTPSNRKQQSIKDNQEISSFEDACFRCLNSIHKGCGGKEKDKPNRSYYKPVDC